MNNALKIFDLEVVRISEPIRGGVHEGFTLRKMHSQIPLYHFNTYKGEDGCWGTFWDGSRWIALSE